MYEFEMVLCKTSGSWQGDCCAGCEYDCWKDPERVESVSPATCDYYPMYGSTGTSWEKDSATREGFVTRASAHGGVAAWYFAGYRRTVAYANNSGFAAKIDALVEQAKGWTDVPSPGEVWDLVRGERAEDRS